MLTQKQLQKELVYDLSTGEFHRRIARCNRVEIGDLVGTLDSHGYLQIRVSGRLYLGNRLAWLYMTGDWPPLDIEHRDNVRSNNRWHNLRLTTRVRNGMNRRCRKDSLTKMKNIMQCGEGGRYRVRVSVGRRRVHVGYFDTLKEAEEAHVRAAVRYYGAFGRITSWSP